MLDKMILLNQVLLVQLSALFLWILCLISFCSFRMGDTSRACTHAHARGATNEGESSNLTPPPSMVQLMAMYKTNRADNMWLLERIERNTAQCQNNQVGIKDFTRLTPPVFSYSTEPLDADYWLRTMERKLQVGHVAQADWVTFAAYHLEGAAKSWWANFLAM